ncbi:MAG: hypothetical protein ACM3XS_02180 [Bacteroidota bacterium]
MTLQQRLDRLYAVFLDTRPPERVKVLADIAALLLRTDAAAPRP